MGVYVNLHAGVGKPLWEITVGEFSVWLKVPSSLFSNRKDEEAYFKRV